MSNYYQKLSENIFKRMYSAFKNKLGSMRLEPPHPMDNAFTSPYWRSRDADPPSLQDIHPALGTNGRIKGGPKKSPFWTNNPERAKFMDAYRKQAAARGRLPNPNFKEKQETVEGTIMDYRTSIRALFEAVLNEEGFEYQKPGQLSKSKRNQAEYADRREKELSGRIVTTGGGNLIDKHLMPHQRASARGVRAIKTGSPHSKDRYGGTRSVPDTHTFMTLAHAKEDRAAKIAARQRRLAAKARTQNSSTDHSRDNLRAIFEAIVNESRKGYMARLGKKPTKDPTTGKTKYMSDKELGKAIKTKDQGSDWSGQEPKFTNKEALKALGSTQRKFFDPKKKK